MNKIKLSVVLFFIILACDSKNFQFTKGERFFIDILFNKKNELKKGKHIIFVLNQSQCTPCEEKVKQFYLQKFSSAKKLFVVPFNRKPTQDEQENFVSVDHNTIAKCGLLRANGAILLFVKNECKLIASIDLQNLSDVNKKIKSILK